MKDNKLGAYSIFRALKHQFENCQTDEYIGMKEMLKYHWYLLRNNAQRNLELENKQLREKVRKLELENDDLKEDMNVLERRLK